MARLLTSRSGHQMMWWPLPQSRYDTTCFAGLPIFDAMLLGLGPDGHVASLFPNRSQIAATDSWVLPVENSPKPPPERITMSLPVINR